MKKMDWFPEYWNFVEKVKLFDFWRSRYCKNKLYFSPNKECCGGVGFFDASYESLKYPNDNKRFKRVKKEYLQRRDILLKEIKSSQEVDKKRLVLLLDVEEKAFEYYKAKIILKPIEDDIPEILKQSIWLIDEKERVFKEAFSYLIEYDRIHLSPITYPERKLLEEPLTISESYNWLIREGRLFGKLDNDFFNKHLNQINLLEKANYIFLNYQPEVLINRNKSNILREEKKGFYRTKNGELFEKRLNKKGEVFERPVVFYSHELKEESIENQINKFREQDIEKYKTDYDNEIKIFKNDEALKMRNISIFERKGRDIPKRPYILLEKNIFNKIEKEENIIEELKEFIKNKKNNLEIEASAEKKEKKIFSMIYLFFNKDNKIQKTILSGKERVNIENRFLEKDGIVFLSAKENEEEIQDLNETESEEGQGSEESGEERNKIGYWDEPEDEFDDKTRFKFFLIDKNKLSFNRKLLIKKFINNKNKMLNKFKTTPTVLKTKAMVLNLKNKLVKETKKIKLGLETEGQRLANKMENLNFKEKIALLKEKVLKRKEEEKVKIEAPKYKMKM